MAEDNVIFERNMEVAEIKRTQIEGGGKKKEEVEIMLRGSDCILALRRFDKAGMQFVDGEDVYVEIKRYI